VKDEERMALEAHQRLESKKMEIGLRGRGVNAPKVHWTSGAFNLGSGKGTRGKAYVIG
jgi:hypothetical protein